MELGKNQTSLEKSYLLFTLTLHLLVNTLLVKGVVLFQASNMSFDLVVKQKVVKHVLFYSDLFVYFETFSKEFLSSK